MNLLRTLAWDAWALLSSVGDVRPWLAELADFALLTPAAKRLRLAQQLHAQVLYFARREDALPEWVDASKVTDPDEFWALWPSLPILTKSMLNTRFRASVIQSRFEPGGTLGSTGGSTGEPTAFLHDQPMIQATAATSLFSRLAFGWRPGMPMVIVWGSERDIGRRRSFRGRIGCYLRSEWLIDGYHLSDATADAVLSVVRRHAPIAMHGFTSMLEFVAQNLLERGLAPPKGSVRIGWNGGEMLFPQSVRLFEQAFGSPLLNLYGGRELGAMAYQPTPTAPLSVLRPLVFLEIVDDVGRPVSHGETGRLIWTSTVCRGTPFLRYDIGDLGCSDQDSVDESGIAAIRELHGRRAGLVRLSNGSTINCLYWNHLLKEFPEIRQFQVAILEGGESLQLRLSGAGMGLEREAKLRRIVRGFLGEIPFSIVWLERIARTKQGKLEQVVRDH